MLSVGEAILLRRSILLRAYDLLKCEGVLGRRGQQESLPVKVLPKTSSSGGRSSFGVVVLVMDKASGSILGSLAMASSWDCMLYGLLSCQLRLLNGDSSFLEVVKQDLRPLKTGWRAMLSGKGVRIRAKASGYDPKRLCTRYE